MSETVMQILLFSSREVVLLKRLPSAETVVVIVAKVMAAMLAAVRNPFQIKCFFIVPHPFIHVCVLFSPIPKTGKSNT